MRLAIQSVPDLAATQPADLLDEVADRLVGGQIGGWFQGGAELGPRALGARSVICSPCGADTKARVNARVKFREEFRPFAPSVLAEHAASWFDFDLTAPDSPFMLRVVPFREERRPVVPAVVHVDGTGRLQTLTERDNGLFYQLVSRFHARSGVPMLLNTSMNVRGEPLAETPDDALWCLLGTGLDFCVVHDWIVTKRHTFGSILDYVPRVIAGDSITAADAADRDTVAAHRPAGKSTVRTFTPWGESEPQIPARLLPLLEKIDGRRDGHALERALGKSPSSPEITHDLLLLRRLRVIAFLP